MEAVSKQKAAFASPCMALNTYTAARSRVMLDTRAAVKSTRRLPAVARAPSLLAGCRSPLRAKRLARGPPS